MPISWKGTRAQYVGRLHRQRVGKAEVLVVDYVDELVPGAHGYKAATRISGARLHSGIGCLRYMGRWIYNPKETFAEPNGMHFDEIDGPEPEFLYKAE
jgi:hypothetical protein